MPESPLPVDTRLLRSLYEEVRILSESVRLANDHVDSLKRRLGLLEERLLDILSRNQD